MPPDPASPGVTSRLIRVESLRLRGESFALAWNEAERAALAAELGLISIESIEARYELRRNGETVAVEGAITAALHQACTVTLEPIAAQLDVPVRLSFAPPAVPGEREEKLDALDIAFEADDPPEPLIDGVIDLGEVTREFLSLALDPYPRKPGATFAETAPAEPQPNPFAVLSRLKSDG